MEAQELLDRINYNLNLSNVSKSWPIYVPDADQNDPDYKPPMLDRSQVLTASENMRCLRRLFLEKLNAPKIEPDTGEPVAPTGAVPEIAWGFSERGHNVEAWVVEQVFQAIHLHDGDELMFAGNDQMSFLDRTENPRLSGTPDGLMSVLNGSQLVLLEVKSVDPRTNFNNLTKPKNQHYHQMQQNMALLNINGFPVTRGIIVYVNCSDYKQMFAFNVQWTEGGKTYLDRYERLFMAEDAAELPAEGLTNQSDDCKYCPFTEQCSAIQGESGSKTIAAPVFPTNFAPRGVADTVRQYYEVDNEEKALKKVKEALGATIKEYAEKENDREINTGSYLAIVEPVAGRKTLDVKAYAAKTGVDPKPFYNTGKPSLRLTVQKIEKEE